MPYFRSSLPRHRGLLSDAFGLALSASSLNLYCLGCSASDFAPIVPKMPRLYITEDYRLAIKAI